MMKTSGTKERRIYFIFNIIIEKKLIHNKKQKYHSTVIEFENLFVKNKTKFFALKRFKYVFPKQYFIISICEIKENTIVHGSFLAPQV